MKVKINKSFAEGYWYSMSIGKVFEVNPAAGECSYTVVAGEIYEDYRGHTRVTGEGSHLISINDCEVMDEAPKLYEVVTIYRTPDADFDTIAEAEDYAKNKLAVKELKDCIYHLSDTSEASAGRIAAVIVANYKLEKK